MLPGPPMPISFASAGPRSSRVDEVDGGEAVSDGDLDACRHVVCSFRVSSRELMLDQRSTPRRDAARSQPSRPDADHQQRYAEPSCCCCD